VGAKAAIYGLLRDATQRGMAVLVNSSDTKELAELCDRVLVLDRGRQVAEFQGPQRQGLPCRHHAGITQARGGYLNVQNGVCAVWLGGELNGRAAAPLCRPSARRAAPLHTWCPFSFLPSVSPPPTGD
jgi:hypothetical protein